MKKFLKFLPTHFKSGMEYRYRVELGLHQTFLIFYKSSHFFKRRNSNIDLKAQVKHHSNSSFLLDVSVRISCEPVFYYLCGAIPEKKLSYIQLTILDMFLRSPCTTGNISASYKARCLTFLSSLSSKEIMKMFKL